MGKKKMPLGMMILLGLTLATICIGTTWLFAASLADPDLFVKVTTPVVEFVEDSVDYAEKQVEKLGNSWDNSVQNVKNYFAEKKESVDAYFKRKEDEKKAQELIAERKEEVLAELALEDNQSYQDTSLAAPRDLADYEVTHFEVNDFTGLELVLGGNHPLIYFNQTDPQWGKYGTDSISGYGCGPTAMAMVVSTLKGTYITPQEMSDIFVEEGYWAKGGGTYYHFADGCGEVFDLNVAYLSAEETTADDLRQHILENRLIVALVGPGHFTSGGHYIVLRGVTLSGDILVADPASRDRSLILWDPQLILDELSSSRAAGAPMWVFSKGG
ncbi:MAG: C39 family peptidase [Eubacteriales bacterium]